MGKFDKAKSTQSVKKVAKASNEKANLVTIKYYKNEVLLDHPRNNEDISSTEDIEKSIMEQGFTDPMEITDFGAEEGKYYIVSGHRRRRAGVKKGMTEFPCILRHFNSDAEVYNYVLFSNAQRDSAKDPLLLAKRYKMHEDYLREIEFKGAIGEEVAKRLGLQKAQADRYKAMNKVILPIWDLVTSGTVGMSSITDSGLYTHTPEEQEEILKIFNECIDNTVELTRSMVSKIVKGYRDGKKSWLEVIQIEMSEVDMPKATPEKRHDTGVSLMNVNTEPVEQTEKATSPLDRNNEVNIDFSHREGLPTGQDPYAEERLTPEDYEVIEKNNVHNKENAKKPQITKVKAGADIINYANKLSDLLHDFYDFGTEDVNAIEILGSLARDIMAELNNIAATDDNSGKAKDELIKIGDELTSYIPLN